MDKKEYIEKVLGHIENKAFLTTVKDELENHIADREEYYTESGYDIQTAQQKAVEHMGNADTVGEEMNLLHDYKKHKIICIIGLIVFSFNMISIVLINSIFDSFIRSNSLIILCVIFANTYIIYKYAFTSRNKIVLFFNSLISFVSVILILKEYLFYFDYSTIHSITEDFMLLFLTAHTVISITCCGEINSIINGKQNKNLIKRYESYKSFHLYITIIFIILTIAIYVIKK